MVHSIANNRKVKIQHVGKKRKCSGFSASRIIKEDGEG